MSEKNSTAKSTGMSGKLHSGGKILGNMRGDRGNITKLTVKIILVLLAIVLLVTFWRNRVAWSCANISQCAKDMPIMNGGGDGFPVSVSGGNALQLEPLSGGVAVLSDTTLTVVSKSSKEAVSRAHFMSEPVMKTAGRYAMLIDAGNHSYRLETVADTLVTGNTETSLLGCAVSENGSYALIVAGDGMLSTVEVCKRGGTIVHKWSTAVYYITNAALSADGRYLAMSGITAEGGRLKGIVIIHRVGVEGEVSHFELDDELILDLGFSDAGTLFAVGENSALIISENGTQCSNISLGGKAMCCDISGSAGAAIYVSTVEDNSHGRLILLDTRGNERCSLNSDTYGTAVSLSEDGCCLLGRGTANAYRLNGDPLGAWNTGTAASDIQQIGAKYYVLEGMNVSQLSVK